MINYHETLLNALNNILPTHYEMVLHSGLQTPCLSYMELDNSVEANGDTIGYSRVKYQIKVWSREVEELQQYTLLVDNTLRALGFTRIASLELYDNNSTMMQKILTYEALALEEFN